MKARNPLVTRTILVLILVSLFGVALAQTPVSNILDLWNVRNGLTGSYEIVLAEGVTTIDMSVTNPANLDAWNTDTSYEAGNMIKFTDGFAYYCILNLTSTDGTQDPGNTTHWTKMWEAIKGWEPIGFQNSPTDFANGFTGNFDGNGKTISKLYINRGAADNADPYAQNNTYSNNVGLFGFVSSNATANNIIENVKLTDVNIRGRRGTGALIGKVLMPSNASRKTFVQNCSVDGGTVMGFGATGGLVGANNSDRRQQVPVIQYCWSSVTVSSTDPTNTALNSGDNNNPYNIKYGGIVGCNETGVTFDCYAQGAVSGGDRVGGIAGCTIDGAVIRCYSIGNVTQGIASSSWEGGVGGITGRIVGKLPPGLGGFQGSGSVQYCYYNSGITIKSAGGPANTVGATSSSDMTTVPIHAGIYANWDFTSVWSHTTNGSYPVFKGSIPAPYFYKSTADGDWSDATKWRKSATVDGTYDVETSIFPDFANSPGIIIGSNMAVDIDVSVDQMTIESGKTLTINSGKRLYVSNNTETYDLTNNGIITVTGTLEVGQSAGFENKGTLTINGTFINSGTTVWTSGTATAAAASTIKYNGALAQSTRTGFPSTINDMEIDNAAGVTFSDAFTINGTLTVTDGLITGTSNTDGFHSVNFKRLKIDESGNLITGFSASTNPNGDGANMTRIKREWTINGTINNATEANRVKTITFYWTETDDYGFDWAGVTAAVYIGTATTSSLTGNVTVDVNGLRSLAINYTFDDGSKNGAKAVTFKIGAENNQTLPVELSSFVAQVFQGTSIMLQWQTQSETNVAGYQIYRGNDDQLTEATLLDVFINATNTSQTQYYAFYDRELYAPGVYYYWLESVDFDGSNQLFGPIPVHFEGIEQGIPSVPAFTAITKNYPNPFNPRTNIVFGMEKDGALILDIYNARGQKVRSLFSGNRKSGWYQMEWDGKNDNGQQLGSGVYFIRMQADGKTITHKAVLMK